MKRRTELILITLFLLLGAGLRAWDLTRLPLGFNNEELAHIRLTEAVRQGDISVYYQVGDGHGRAGMYAILNAPVRERLGDGLLGYRMLSFWGSLLTLALLAVWVRRLFGPFAALMALGLMSVNLRAILLARTATSEALVPLYTLLILWELVVAFNLRPQIRFRAPVTTPFVLLAVLFGLSGYLHYTALVLGPLGAGFFVHLLITRQPLSRRVWNAAIFVVVLATVVAMPYLISTLRDTAISEPDILWVERPRSVADVFDGFLQTIGGVIWQGDPRVTANLPELPLFGPVISVLLIMGLVEALRHWREPRYGLLLLTLAAGLLTDVWVGREPTFSAQLVALPALYCLPGIGTLVLWRALRGRGVSNAWQPVALLLVIMLAANGLLVRHRLFETWRSRPQVAAAYHSDVGRVAAYLDRSPEGLPVSLCAAGLREPNEIGLSTRQMLGLMRHREALNVRHSDCRSGLVFIDAGAPMRFIFVNPADRALMPPELADWLKTATVMPVDELPNGALLRLDVEERIRDSGGYWGALAPTYFNADDVMNVRPARLPVTLEQNLTFAGYDPAVLRERTTGGDPLVLVTYWRTDGVLPANLGVFAHVLGYWEDEQTDERVTIPEPWAEANALDVVPAELRSRDFFVQVSYIWLSDSMKPGEYALMVGAYDGSVYNHLGVLDRETGKRWGDRLFLGDLHLLAPVATNGS